MSDLEHPTFDNIEERQAKWYAKQNAKKMFHYFTWSRAIFSDLATCSGSLLAY
jgi:hypothetical protein